MQEIQPADGSWIEELKDEWRILHTDTANKRMLVISKKVIAAKLYHEPGGNITWEGCSLRKWLNGKYYDSLPGVLKSRVIETLNETEGCKQTRDKVFLLSTNEASAYFHSNDDRVSKYESGRICWWLRSPGFKSDGAACVHYHGGFALDGFNDVNRDNGIRPAMWLNL